MATQTNPFQTFINGLFGSVSSTSAIPTSTGGSSQFTGPYASGFYAGSPAPAKPAASSPVSFPMSGNVRDPRIGANASYLDASNATASRGTVPYVPTGANGYGGQSLVPNQTNVRTGLPGSSVPGSVSPESSRGVLPNFSSPTRTSTSSSSPTVRAASSPTASAASFGSPAAAAAAPVSASSISYAGPSSYTGAGGGTGSDYRKAYTDLLSTLYNQDDLTDANDILKRLKKQAADTQLTQRHEEARIRENDVGQGLKSYNGQLSENNRLAAAQLADLAIASSPYEDYIKNAMGAAKEQYGVGSDEEKFQYQQGRDATTDARNASQDALQEKKFNEDVRQFGLRYALDKATENRLSTTANKSTKQDYVSQYIQAFTPGTAAYKQAQENLGGIPPTDENGYITPEAFKAASAEAAQNGISRKEFIELVGSQLFSDKKGNVDPKYGLTQVEKKLIGVPE